MCNDILYGIGMLLVVFGVQVYDGWVYVFGIIMDNMCLFFSGLENINVVMGVVF